MSDHTVNADAVRPARMDGTCFYCRVPVGGQHDFTCVLRERLVRVRITVEADLAYPESWDSGRIEFHANESSSCADNLIQRIVEYRDKLDESGRCMCGMVSLEVIPTPTDKATRE